MGPDLVGRLALAGTPASLPLDDYNDIERVVKPRKKYHLDRSKHSRTPRASNEARAYSFCYNDAHGRAAFDKHRSPVTEPNFHGEESTLKPNKNETS